MSLDKRRCLKLNSKERSRDAKSVLYVMSRDQRTSDNHALLFAQHSALDSALPLVVQFNVLSSTGSRSKEQYQFMIDGLKELKESLQEHGITFVVTRGKTYEEVGKLVKAIQPKEVFFDFSPLAGPRSVQKKIASTCEVLCTVVDTHNIIPVWVTSDKEEYAAHTIRNKIHKNLEEWLTEPPKLQKHPHKLSVDVESAVLDSVLKDVTADESGVEHQFKPGEQAALKALEQFLKNDLKDYGATRNKPSVDGTSNVSPYLHYGQISALRVALSVVGAMTEPPYLFRYGKLASFEGEPTLNDSADALLEELIVRKELADNYCLYAADYTSLAGAKDWARTTLEDHKADDRGHLYSLEELQQCKTHDAAWNAAQAQMMKVGKMHGYMRMYWAKKVLEWSPSADEAIKRLIYLNDFYSIDGGDPNGYVGIMWSVAGVHDRPWTERDVFGKIRYMNYGGLKRKFDIQAYEDKWLNPEQLELNN